MPLRNDYATQVLPPSRPKSCRRRGRSLAAAACAELKRASPGRRGRSGTGEHEANAGERDAQKLGQAQWPCFGSQKAKAVDERRRDGDDQEIDEEGLGRAEPWRDKGEAGGGERPHQAAQD